MLTRPDGHALYWETSGHPEGEPALHLHGGPGVGLLTGHRRRFDPERYRVVALDQRGCGRSRPLVSEPGGLDGFDLAAMIEDLEALREHLRIERWLVTGVSWGTTLGLAYAEAHPERVTGFIAMCVFTTTATEVDWMIEGVGRFFPEAWSVFEAAGHRRAGERLVEAYHRRITDAVPVVRAAAAEAWCAWEDVHVSLGPNARPNPSYADPHYRAVFATSVIHMFRHAAFLAEGTLLEGVARVAHLPATLIHGRLDVSSPIITAHRLHRAWTASRLVIIEDEGHGGEAMVNAMCDAIAAHPRS
jgi:proline iminopeptidase